MGGAGDVQADEADGIEAQPEVQFLASEPFGTREDRPYVRGPVSTELRGSASPLLLRCIDALSDTPSMERLA